MEDGPKPPWTRDLTERRDITAVMMSARRVVWDASETAVTRTSSVSWDLEVWSESFEVLQRPHSGIHGLIKVDTFHQDLHVQLIDPPRSCRARWNFRGRQRNRISCLCNSALASSSSSERVHDCPSGGTQSSPDPSRPPQEPASEFTSEEEFCRRRGSDPEPCCVQQPQRT